MAPRTVDAMRGLSVSNIWAAGWGWRSEREKEDRWRQGTRGRPVGAEGLGF